MREQCENFLKFYLMTFTVLTFEDGCHFVEDFLEDCS